MNEIASHRRVLVFELTSSAGDMYPDLFALDLAAVDQVIEVQGVSVVPLAPMVVEGLLTHHGRIVTVVDPAPLLGLDSQPFPASQVVVLRKTDQGSSHVGLKVFRSRDIVPAARLEPVQLPPGPGIETVARFDQRLVHVVAPAVLNTTLGHRFETAEVRPQPAVRSSSHG